MSLLIGVPCVDTVTIGADSTATLGGMLQNTIQHFGEKLKIVKGEALIGVAGAASISQQLTGALEEMLGKRLADGRSYADLPPHSLAGLLHGHFLAATELTHLSWQRAKEIVGNAAALNAHLVRSLVAVPCQGKPTLYRTDEFCTVERVDPSGFESIGVGQKHADPFLAFLKRTLWNNQPPDTTVAELTVVWALRHAIEVGTGGVADPKVLYTMRVLDGKATFEKLDEAKIEGYENRIDDIENKMRREASLPKALTMPPTGPEEDHESNGISNVNSGADSEDIQD